MDPAYSRHSRRSHPNLHHLSLLPLTPHYPLPAPSLSSTPPTLSYLAPKSLPTTPSILSRSSSRTRIPTSRSTHALPSLDLTLDFIPPPHLAASKSTTALAQHTRPPRPRRTTATDNDWLSQTGTLLAASARAEKGQAWLATRSSCSELAAADYGFAALSLDTMQSLYAGGEADDEYSPTSYRTPFTASRAQSRFASARNSRRGSGVGVGVREEGGMGMEPDFVDGGEDEEEEEEEVDEGEVRRLIGVRMGGWVDWLVGWMDFRGDEEGEEQGEEEGDEDVGLREKERDEGVRRWKRGESDRVVVREREAGDRAVEKPPEDGEGAWKDAAWLLSVATKIIA